MGAVARVPTSSAAISWIAYGAMASTSITTPGRHEAGSSETSSGVQVLRNSLQMAANNVNKSFSQLAEEIGLSQDILSKLEQHSIDTTTIPRELCHRLVKVLQRPLAAVEMYLGLVTHKQLTQGVAETLASYYVEAQHGLDMHSLSFQQAIEQSKNLSDEQKVVWHSILEREGLL